MRNLFPLLITGLLLVIMSTSACRKKKQPEPADIDLCVHRLYYSHATQGPSVPDAQMDTVNALFSSNHLSFSNLQVIGIINDKKYRVIHIEVNQFINNLLVFYGQTGFHFREINGNYIIDTLGLEDDLIHATNIESAYQVSPLHAANILYQQITKDQEISYRNEGWEDSCYNITLGAYSITADTYGLVWKVTPKNQLYPYCFVNARSGELINYNNGIIIF